MLTLKELCSMDGVVETFGSKFPSNHHISISTDTRTIEPSQTFLALEGERFRPMEFLSKLERPHTVIYTKSLENDRLAKALENKHFFISTKDSLSFLQDVGTAISSRMVESGGKLVAISGSNGKTTTKEMLFHLLKRVESNTVCTQKNNNNHIGVPLTLLQIEKNTKICVLELGSNHPGEIPALCDIANPNFGVTTNIGDTHLEFFHTRKNVFKEEGFLYHSIDDLEVNEKVFFLNTDDEFLKTLPIKKHVKTYGASENNDYRIDARVDGATVHTRDDVWEITNPKITGGHNFFNMSVALVIADTLVPGFEKELLDAASTFRPTKNRSEWLDLGDSKVFLDAYNANPTSMRSAVTGFKEKILSDGMALADSALVLGDMNELGGNAPDYHQELGEFCMSEGFTNVVFIGRFAKAYNKGFGGKGEEFSSVKDFCTARKNYLLGFKRSFIKGSRSLQLESIVDIK